jgi:hypothetical protein
MQTLLWHLYDVKIECTYRNVDTEICSYMYVIIVIGLLESKVKVKMSLCFN